MKIHTLGPLLALVAGLPVVCAQTTSGPVTTTPQEDRERAASASAAAERAGVRPITDETRELVEKMIRLATHEVALSRIAEENATAPEVRSYAKEMVSAHSDMLDELRAMLADPTPGSRPNPAADFDERSWRMKKPADFDEDYIEAMVDLHEENDDLFEDATKSKDPQLAAHAGRHHATVRLHLERAKALAKALD